MKKFLMLIVLFVVLSGCSYVNLDDVKEHADERWREMGFEIIGYDGYQWSLGIGRYGGAKVWYVLKKINGDPVITYGGFLQRWGDEYHMYDLRAYDAIGPK